MSYFPWLTILVVLPIFAGSLIFFLPHIPTLRKKICELEK